MRRSIEDMIRAFKNKASELNDKKLECLSEEYYPKWINPVHYKDKVKQQFADLICDKIYDALDNSWIDAYAKIDGLPDSDEEKFDEEAEAEAISKLVRVCVDNYFGIERIEDKPEESLTEAKDLSQIEGTIANVLSNDSSWKESSSITELVSSLQKIFDNNGINTKASNRLLDRVSKSKGIVSALSTVYNSILAGSNEAVIK